MPERDKSPIKKDLSPLVLWKTYEEGLLPTPNIRPLRHVIWVPHPVLELENALNLAKKNRNFSLLHESEPCEYDQGIFLKYQTGIYGEKIARISVDSDEAMKSELKDEYSPRTKEIYGMLECQLLHALQDACTEEQGRDRRKAHSHRNSCSGQTDSRPQHGGTESTRADPLFRVRDKVAGRRRGTHARVQQTRAEDAF